MAEVYAVHAAFVALTIWLALRLNNRPTTWAALILGLVWGIAFGFHLTSIFLLPIISSLGWSIVGIRCRASAVAIHRIESRAWGSDVGKPDDAGWMVVAGKQLTL
jgi:hypothetical protein